MILEGQNFNGLRVSLHRVESTNSKQTLMILSFSVGHNVMLVWGKLQPVVSFYQIRKQKNHLHLCLGEGDDFKLYLAVWCSSRWASWKFGKLAGQISTVESKHVCVFPSWRKTLPVQHGKRAKPTYRYSWTNNRRSLSNGQNFIANCTIFMKHSSQDHILFRKSQVEATSVI